MDPNTHGEVIIGNGFMAFVDGIPDQCDHDDEGEGYHFDGEGNYYKYSEAPDFDTDRESLFRWLEEYNIRGGCVSCSKCGKPFSPPMF